MAEFPTTEWIATLDRMSDNISRSLNDLDRSEREWASLAQMPSPTAPEQLFAWLERRLGAWDSKLGEATALAESVEVQLQERESTLMQWHETIKRWRDLIQQEEGTLGPSMGPRVTE